MLLWNFMPQKLQLELSDEETETEGKVQKEGVRWTFLKRGKCKRKISTHIDSCCIKRASGTDR